MSTVLLLCEKRYSLRVERREASKIITLYGHNMTGYQLHPVW